MPISHRILHSAVSYSDTVAMLSCGAPTIPTSTTFLSQQICRFRTGKRRRRFHYCGVAVSK